jgi:hypothetical protein
VLLVDVQSQYPNSSTTVRAREGVGVARRDEIVWGVDEISSATRDNDLLAASRGNASRAN